MDVPAASHIPATCQPWMHDETSTASTQGQPHQLFSNSQHFSPGLVCNQNLPQPQLSDPSCQIILSTTSTKTLNQNLSPVILDSYQTLHISSMVEATSHRGNMCSSSLSPSNQDFHFCKHYDAQLCSPHSANQRQTFQQNYQSLQNEPQSPSQKDFSHNPSLSVQNAILEPQTTYFEGAKGLINNFPTSPAHLRPAWTRQSTPTAMNVVPQVPAHYYNEAVPEKTVLPQSPSLESRCGLDPKLLPSAVKVMADDRAEWEGKIFVSEHFSSVPPLATTPCFIEDKGSASPHAIRSTSYCVPCEGQTALLSGLPLGALITPLAKPSTQESLPLCRESEPVQGCAGCGAFMCPAMDWQDCGQRFYCPFCGTRNDVPWQHYQPTTGTEGVRVDKGKRPELSLGSYEILHSQKDKRAALLFAVDVSASALREGHLDLVTQQIHTLLSFLNSEDSASWSEVPVGLMTYDSRIHLYDLSLSLSRPHMLVITETEDMQLPVREGLLVPLKDSIDSMNSVLQLIPQFSPECDKSNGISVELPVRAALNILQAMKSPGKLLIFHSAPIQEAGNSSSSLFGSYKPKTIFQPSEFAVSLAKECICEGCGVHLFALSHQNVGGAWPGNIPYLTGGALYMYSHLQGDLDRQRLSADLRRAVEKDTGYKAELKTFVSKDLRVSGSYGLFVPGPVPAQVKMATLDWRTTIAVELTHTRTLDEQRGVAIQTAISYSTLTGQRKTRVHTLTLRCSRHLQDAFRSSQAQTLLTFYCKKMYCEVLERPLQDIRAELQTELTEALASYRKHCRSASVSTGQLVLPHYLRALPVYMNSLRKSEVLLPGLRSSIHQRLQLRCQLLSMDTTSTATHFYPLLLPLLPSLEGEVRCSASSLEPSGLYLVHAPLTLLIWVGNQVPACTLVQLFNISCFSSLPSGETKLPSLDNHLSISVRSLIEKLDTQSPFARQLSVVKQGDCCEEALQRLLVEDKSPNGGASYADFLYHVHVNSIRLLQ